MQELIEQCQQYIELYVLLCPYMTHLYLQHRLTFLAYGFVISVAALDMLMGRYYFTYLICGMVTFPLMEGAACLYWPETERNQ